MTTRLMTLLGLILVAAFSRLIPHPWNFTAIGAIALFGGSFVPSKKLSLVLPWAALILSDLVLGFHSTMVFVYAAFTLNVLIGWGLRDNQTPVKVTSYALLSSSLFFLITNFGVWAMGGMYPMTTSGLVSSYVAAIPFFDNQIYGDLFFSGVLFGGYAYLRKVLPEWTFNTQA
jgi:hypothetical protein